MADFDSETNELFIYDDIMPAWLGGVDAASVRSALKEANADSPVVVRINSAGGSVDEGIAIANAIQRHPGGVVVAIDSLAASIASYIAMFGSKITMAENAMLMLHKPWTLSIGDANDLRKDADVLDKYEERIIGAYADRMGKDSEEVAAILEDETWYTAAEALEAGLIDEIGNQSIYAPVVAKGRFAKTPKSLLMQPENKTKRTFCHDRSHFERLRDKCVPDRKSLTRF